MKQLPQFSQKKIVIFSLCVVSAVLIMWIVINSFSNSNPEKEVAHNLSSNTSTNVLGEETAQSTISEEVTIDDPAFNMSSSSTSRSTSSNVSSSSSISKSSSSVAISSETVVPTSAKVIRVIDGDTIEIEGGYKLRYIGIDTPELSTNDCYAAEATNRNSLLVMGKTVELEKDVSETDKYGRLLRYVRVNGVFVNESLVRDGFAKATAYSPDTKYQASFTRDESLAKSDAAGMWSACNKSSSSTTPTVTSTTNSTTTTFTAVGLDQVSSSSSTYSLPKYNCHIIKNCTMITECDEAYFQLKSCGNSSIDADSDGIPCETLCK